MMIEIALLYHCESREWLSFKQTVAVLHARKAAEVLPLLREIDARIGAEQRTAVGFVTYEAASGFDAGLSTHPSAQSELPLISFALFRPAQVVQLPPPGSKTRPATWHSETGYRPRQRTALKTT